MAIMVGNRYIWSRWSHRLQKWGLQDFTAWAFEAFGPLHLIGAQAVYLGQPFLQLVLPETHVKELAHVLEQPPAGRAFFRLSA